jgi:membrane-associated phospholipid phosphatase
MRRYLLAALWPAGMITITAAAVVAARRVSVAPPRPALHDPGDPGLGWSPGSELPGWREGVVKLAAISVAGGVLAYRVMDLIGGPVVKYGPRIDVPVERWTSRHQVEAWSSVVKRLNNIGSSWTSWAAAGTAGACLSATWSRQKWFPPSVLASAVLVDKLTTQALRRRIDRVGPPASPQGTYPAGGPDRVVLFTALISNLLWREFSGSARGRILALATIGGFAFNISYCRQYLSRHWLTDIVSGLVYGAVLYVPFATAIRMIAGPPAVKPGGPPARVIPIQRDARWPSGGQGEGGAAGVGEPMAAW